jgi:medium-chain acyl-[acyl-carrier-protein] hydrolase
MYEIKSRIRFSETDKNGYITVPAIINYFQDVSTFQSIDVGTMDMEEDGHPLGWMILSWDIKIDKLPKLGDSISIRTYPLKQKGPFAFRDFTLSNDNEIFVRAHSIWSIIDLDRLMPKKITDTIMNKYGVDEPLPGEWSGRKLPVPKEKEEVMRFEVRPFQLDKNGHMNNERYVSAAIDLLPEGTAFSEIQVGYVSQALLDDEIIICRGLDDKDSDKEVFNLEKEDGSTLCTVIIKVRA